MSKSARLRADDARDVEALAGECGDLGDDPNLCWLHFAERIGRMTGAGMVTAGETATDFRNAMRLPFKQQHWGWENGFDRDGWGRVMEAYARYTPLFCPMTGGFGAHQRQHGIALSRPDVVTDGDWYGSEYYQGYHRYTGADTMMFCQKTLPLMAGRQLGIIAIRPAGGGDFTARQKARVSLAANLVAPLMGREVASFMDASPSDLPPRARQVLQSLLEGDGDKQTAARLGVSRHTVNHYTKRLFHHFGVASRAELLARWARRGVGAEVEGAHRLTIRARQVLRCFLEGDGDKQAGSRLGVSRHTINHYTKILFGHFGVSSRAELLALWVRRGWGKPFGWAEPTTRG